MNADNAPTASQINPQARPGSTLASWASRAGAVVIDLLVLLVPAIVVFAAVSDPTLSSPDREPLQSTGDIVAQVIASVLVSFAIAYALYAPTLMARRERNGQTLGKQAMSIRVVRDNGAPYRYGSAALREIGAKGLLWWFFPPLVLVNYLWPLVDKDNLALHDKLVSSRIVRT